MTDHAAPLQAEASDAAVPRKVRSRLFLKYAGLFVAVVCVALLTNGVFEIWVSYREHKDALIEIQHEQAESAAAKIGQFIKEIESQVGWTTQLLWSAGTIEQRRFDALRLLRQVPAITELAQVDASGKEQLRVSRLAMDVVGSGLDLSQEPKFTDAVKNKVYYGPVYFRRESEPYMTLSLSGTRRDAGVSIAEVNLKLIWDVVSKIKVGTRGQAYVVDAQGRLIAHPDISLVLRKTDMTRLAQVQAARQVATSTAAAEIENATDIQGRRVLTAFAPVAPLGWTVFVELPVEEAYQPLITSIQRTALVLFGALFLAALAGIFLARRMVVPIQALRAGAARIGGGDLSQRISIKSGDELEALADQFNDMAGRLQESYAGLEQKVEARTRELSASLEQQTATSEVLRVISSSPGDLAPVFEVMLANATRICDAKFGNLWLSQDDGLLLAATYGIPAEYHEHHQVGVVAHPGLIPTVRAANTLRTVHVADLREDQAYLDRDRVAVTGVEILKIRTLLAVPMLKDQKAIGAFAIYRQEVRPFTDKQIELVSNFAAQAVIAIENTRLLKELRQRTDDLSEALEQQTATAEILQVINSSPGDLAPVFDAMVESAMRFCQADYGHVYSYDGELFHLVAAHGEPRYLDWIRQSGPRTAENSLTLERIVAGAPLVHIADIAEDAGYRADNPRARTIVNQFGIHTLLTVALRKEGALLGTFVLYRQQARPFSDKQIALVQSFAAQAVIAMENARLLNELRQRTGDLSESLEQQTATSEVLKVISSSPGELEPVFQAMLENAVRICGAKFGNLFLREGDGLRIGATHGAPPAYVDFLRNGQVFQLNLLSTELGVGRLVQTKECYQVADVAAAPTLGDKLREATINLAGARTLIGVPMLKDDQVIGAIVIYRQEVSPFTDKQIELVTNFAAQAVIAIENTRLLKELRQRTDDLSESLEQQTAISDILRVISSSPSDVKPVLDTVAERAAHICEAYVVDIVIVEDGKLSMGGSFGDLGRPIGEAVTLDRTTVMGRSICDKEPVHVADLQNAGDEFALGRELAIKYGHRTILAVPLIREGEALGTILVRRAEVRPFEDKHIVLLKTFAAQAVIAIENTRLLNELRQRTDDLSESLEQQTATAEVLKVISSSPGELEPVFQAMLANATRICGAGFGGLFKMDNGEFEPAAQHNQPEELNRYLAKRGGIKPRPGSTMERLMRTKSVVHIEDLLKDADGSNNPAAKYGNARTYLGVPMLKENELIGAIVIYRQEVRPFTDKQIELVTNFAAQAVIAIENTRLLNELRESLEQQTATSEVLKVISGSPGELEPVFQAMLENATRICEAKFGTLFRFDGKTFLRAAAIGNPPALEEYQTQLGPFLPQAGSLLDRALQTKKVVPHCTTTRPEASDQVRRSHCRCRRARDIVCRADAEGGRVGRCHRHLPPGGAAVHRQADRAGDEFCRPGRHRHRERPASQRTAAIAAAADRHRRRAQGHQPLDLRFTDGARYADRIGRPVVRSRYCQHLASERR